MSLAMISNGIKIKSKMHNVRKKLARDLANSLPHVTNN